MTDDEAALPPGVTETETPDDDCTPTTDGILHCLHMLAEEAALLKLPQTLLALERAFETCRREAVNLPPRLALSYLAPCPATARLH